ncbi:MAG: tyrosine-type recombinase/integrase [candidate division Zixibacteria bacterium]|nr:tyrosine-type recombinase/integrase [candidate division Zixibacteria bacterium]
MKGCRPLTIEEEAIAKRSFAGKYAARDRALFILGLKTGFRVAELLSLRLRDVVHAGQLVDRVYVERRNMKKKTEGRCVPLHQEAKAALADWIEQLHDLGYSKDDTFLFQSRKGQNRPITGTSAWHILHDAYEANEFTGKLGTHTMRKTFADRAYNALGGNIGKVARALGHKNINSTMSYLSFKQEEIDNAILNM